MKCFKMEKITITIKKENHKRLAQLKLDKDFKNFDEVLEYIFDKARI